MGARRGAGGALPLLLLLALLRAPPPVSSQASALRAVGAPKNDGRIIIGGLGISGQSTFLTQFTPLFSGYLHASLGTALNRTFVTAYLDFTTTYTAIANAQLDFVRALPRRADSRCVTASLQRWLLTWHCKRRARAAG